ncbi:MAG TPA: serine/threonine-protein kinase [Kofleriaceae bacterium]|nr:serine/threonine-protein kinase [Kofleriaceae bacterium]
MEAEAFGKYLLCERLAEGGMAVVWRAKVIGPSGFEKEFCVKQIREELAARPEFIDLFVAEAKLTVSLTHANIVPIYELGMVDGTYFLALELIDGPTLAKLVKHGALPAPLAAYIVEQVLRGLDYAHRRGVVHRDLSAANVLVSRDGEVKIVDFGIAAPVDGRAVRGGSLGYMAPEQEKGGRADARGDLYAVGVLLWELLAGRRYDGGKAEGPEVLAAVVRKATREAPEDRFVDAATMLGQVSRYLRDMSMGPTQAELSHYVRKRFPDTPRRGDARGDADPTKRTGPQTVPVAGRKQVTFATRLGPGLDGAPAGGRRGWIFGVAVAVMLAVGGGVWWAAQARGPAAVVGVADLGGKGTEGTGTGSATGTGSTGALVARRVGRLAVKSIPAGADVKVGEVIGVTPIEMEVPIDGPVVVHLRKRGFQPVDRSVEPSAEMSVNEKLVATARGELTVNALPWAHVSVDGEKRGDTPLVKLALAVGAHQVRLVCPPTGRELKFTVVVEADKEVKRLADLRGEPRLLD